MQLKANKTRTKKAAAIVAATESAIIANVPAILPDMPAASAIDSAPAPVADAASALPAYKSGARDAATILAQATQFAQYSDRDTAYLAFFGSVMRPRNDSASLADIHAAGKAAPTGNRRSNPFYTGSAKATDAGAINRLIKAGYITQNDSGTRLTATATAIANAAYNSHAKPAKPAE